MLYFRRTVCVSILFSVFLLAGCGQNGSTDSDEVQSSAQEQEAAIDEVVSRDEGSLEARVAARWDALIKRDFAKAYEFETPGYRGIYDLEQFRGSFGRQVGWLEARVVKVEVTDASADVTVSVKYNAMIPNVAQADSPFVSGETALVEKWIHDDGIWYHVPD